MDGGKSKDKAHRKYGEPKVHKEFDELKDEVDKEFDEPQYEVEEEGGGGEQHEKTEGVQELPQDRGQAPLSVRVVTIYYSRMG